MKNLIFLKKIIPYIWYLCFQIKNTNEKNLILLCGVIGFTSFIQAKQWEGSQEPIEAQVQQQEPIVDPLHLLRLTNSALMHQLSDLREQALYPVGSISGYEQDMDSILHSNVMLQEFSHLNDDQRHSIALELWNQGRMQHDLGVLQNYLGSDAFLAPLDLQEEFFEDTLLDFTDDEKSLDFLDWNHERSQEKIKQHIQEHSLSIDAINPDAFLFVKRHLYAKRFKRYQKMPQL